jgi:hypothetical protein
VAFEVKVNLSALAEVSCADPSVKGCTSFEAVGDVSEHFECSLANFVVR